jgi:hypothetical protein
MLGVSETYGYDLARGKEVLKTQDNIISLDKVFARYAAQPGSAEFQAEVDRIKAIWSKVVPDSEKELRTYIVDLIFGRWCDLALDDEETEARQLLYAVRAQGVLSAWLSPGFKRISVDKNDRRTLSGLTDAKVQARGLAVSTRAFELLKKHKLPPAGFFEPEPGVKPDHITAAKRHGYSMFRIHAFSDHVGWLAREAASLEELVKVFTEAYNSDLPADLMFLDEVFGDCEIGYVNNAVMLATHAAQWEKAGEYAVALFRYFPEFLTNDTQGVLAICKDTSMWPAMAAVIAKAPPSFEQEALVARLRGGDHALTNMMKSVEKMLEPIAAGECYIKVLKAGDVKWP